MSGIYMILNTISYDFYIGSAQNFNKRFSVHKASLNKNKHRNQYLQNVYNKHGKEVFEYIILDYCEVEDLIFLEQLYIDLLNPLYNICRIAGSALGIKLSEEAKRKIGLSHITSPRVYKAPDNFKYSMLGKNHTEETKLKISKANKGTKPTKYTLERLSEVKSKVIYQYTLDNVFVKEWKSLISAAKFYGIRGENISRVASGKRKSTAGYIWRYDKIDYNKYK